MESALSFKKYGKIDPTADQEFHRKTRRRLVILVVSIILLVAIVTGAVLGIVVHTHENTSSSGNNKMPGPKPTPSASLEGLCKFTQHPTSCYKSMSSLHESNTTDPSKIFKLSLHVALVDLKKVLKYVTKLTNKIHDKRIKAALNVCETVFDDAVDRLDESISSMELFEKDAKMFKSKNVNDIKTWLSTSITDHETCLDALHEMNATTVLNNIKTAMKNSTEFTSNSMAIAAKMLGMLADHEILIHRRLLGFPGWLSAGDRRLLQEGNPVPDVTVAGDGSGDCKTINEAVAMIPEKSMERFVIHVKAGEYVENVVLYMLGFLAKTLDPRTTCAM